MDDSGSVDRDEPGRDLGQHVDRPGDVATSERRDVEPDSVDELHHDEELAVVRNIEIDDRDKIWMMELRQDLRLAREASRARCLGVPVQELEREPPVVGQTRDLVDDTHAAASNVIHDLVAAGDLAPECEARGLVAERGQGTRQLSRTQCDLPAELVVERIDLAALRLDRIEARCELAGLTLGLLEAESMLAGQRDGVEQRERGDGDDRRTEVLAGAERTTVGEPARPVDHDRNADHGPRGEQQARVQSRRRAARQWPQRFDLMRYRRRDHEQRHADDHVIVHEPDTCEQGGNDAESREDRPRASGRSQSEVCVRERDARGARQRQHSAKRTDLHISRERTRQTQRPQWVRGCEHGLHGEPAVLAATAGDEDHEVDNTGQRQPCEAGGRYPTNGPVLHTWSYEQDRDQPELAEIRISRDRDAANRHPWRRSWSV